MAPATLRPAAPSGLWSRAWLIVAALWVLALLLSPVAASAPRGSAAFDAAALTYVTGHTVCHQYASRSFHLAGAQLAVCARCTGLYAGALAGALAAMARRRAIVARHARLAMVGAALPTALTVMTAWAGWWDPSNIVRAAIAAPLGAIIGWAVPAALDRGLE